MEQDTKKVLVIGLDGATFDIIDPLIQKGKLPNLALLKKNGASAPLKSSIMPNSFPAWVSCVTGVNPGKHGIFWSLIRKDNNSYPLRLMNSLDIKAKTLWQILGNQGYKVGVVNVPTEYPPTKINGFLICGALTPSIDSEFTYPEELRNEILAVVPDYKCEIDYANISLNDLAKQINQSIEAREKLALYLMERKPWDLFFAVFTETDLAQHKFWAGIDRKHPDYSRMRKKFGEFVNEVYEKLDKTIGKMLKKISEDTAVFIISDHGFGPFYQSFSLPQWLVEKKYLVLKESDAKKSLRNLLIKKQFYKKAQRVKYYLSRLLFYFRPKLNVRSLRDKDVLSGEQLEKKIDWKASKAYYTSDNGIRLNLKGREPYGIVIPGKEEDLLKEEIKKELSQIKYSNDQHVFEAVLTKEEAFSGPFVDRASDLITPINWAQAPPVPEKWSFTQTNSTLQGAHSPSGIFILQGKGIKKGLMINSAEIVDITPTILYLFNIPLTEEIDGEVIWDIFEPEFNIKRKMEQ